MIYGNIADLAPPEETLCPRVSDLANRDLWINLTLSITASAIKICYHVGLAWVNSSVG